MSDTLQKLEAWITATDGYAAGVMNRRQAQQTRDALAAAQQTIADLRAEVERLRALNGELSHMIGSTREPSAVVSPATLSPPVPRPPMLRAKPKHLDGYQWFLRGEHYHCWFSEDGRYASEMLEIDRDNSDAAAIAIYESETRPQS